MLAKSSFKGEPWATVVRQMEEWRSQSIGVVSRSADFGEVRKAQGALQILDRMLDPGFPAAAVEFAEAEAKARQLFRKERAMPEGDD